jgi:hypothetical protein
MAGGYRHYKMLEDTDAIKMAGGYRHNKNDWKGQTLPQ